MPDVAQTVSSTPLKAKLVKANLTKYFAQFRAVKPTLPNI